MSHENTMTYEEFEHHILRFVYEEGTERLQPSYLAYALGLPHETVNAYIEQGVNQGLLEMDFTEDGRLEYFIPGVERDRPMPTPVWKAAQPPASAPEEAAPHDGADGSVTGGTPAAPNVPHGRTPELPPTLQSYIRERYGDTDGSITRGGQVAVLDANASVEGAAGPVLHSTSTALVPYEPRNEIMRVETNDDAFCDPSQTIFMRQIRVHGVQSEAELREQIQRLFESFGYTALNVGQERLRFERGSVTFILALVPLFVLILPVFVYLFLYCMGRSTIQQEPIELDVQIRRSPSGERSYDIDLTFIGLHGIVLGAVDQRVLNQEVDTLKDELSWALSA